MMGIPKGRIVDDLHELFEFVQQEHGARAALIAVVRMFTATNDGSIERRPATHVFQAIEDSLGVSKEELLTGYRSRRLARARQVAAWLLRACGYSEREAAKALGCGPANVVYATKTVEKSEDLMAEAAVVAGALKERLGEPDRKLPVIFSAKEAVG
jgi:chromosomal replication initiation ATPase DnaA